MSATITKEQARLALRELLKAIHSAVKECGANGAPSGHLYAAVMNLFTLEQYQAVMGVLVDAGKLRKTGHVYYWVADL